MLRWRSTERTLLHRHRFRQIPRLVNIAATSYRDVVRQQLKRNDFKNWQQLFRSLGNVDHVIGGFFDLLVAFGGERNYQSGAGFDLFLVRAGLFVADH
jgi:hypothetical protein